MGRKSTVKDGKKIHFCKRYNRTHHYVPIYGFHINVVFTQKEFKYLCKKYQDYDFELDDNYNGLSLLNPVNQEVTIGIFNNSLGTIVHECTHASLFMLNERSMDPSDSQGEALAYLQEYLFNLIVKKMKKFNKKGK